MKKDGEAPVSLWEKRIDIELTAVKDHIDKLDCIVTFVILVNTKIPLCVTFNLYFHIY